MALLNSQFDVETVAGFDAEFQVDVIPRNEGGYDEDRVGWNEMIEKYPALRAHCTGVPEVMRAVGFASENDRSVAVRGGGHNVAGTCSDAIRPSSLRGNGTGAMTTGGRI